jgi:hypothetical protein
VTLRVVIGVLGICAASLSHQAMANTDDYIERLASKTQQLEQELAELRAELVQIKQQQAAKEADAEAKAEAARTAQQQQQQATQARQAQRRPKPTPQRSSRQQRPTFLDIVHAGGTPPYEPLRGDPSEWESLGPFYEISPDDELKIVNAPEVYPEDIANTLTFIGGVPVVTSRYFGERAAFDGSDLVTNLPFSNQDMRLLQQKQKVENYLIRKGLPLPEQPVVDLSGDLAMIAFTQKPYTGKTTGTFDIDDIELDVLAQFNRFLTGFMAFQVDPERPASGGPATANSRTFFSKGFLTLGNFNIAPVYATGGQLFIPFGRYMSSLVSTTLPRSLGRTKARAVILGYKQPGEQGLFASVYGFDGDSRKSPGQSGVIGTNLGYTFRSGDFGGELGGGLLSNIADSQFMQFTNGSCSAATPTCFTGFGAGAATERLQKRVPGVNVHGSLSYAEYSIIAEWVSATTHFSSRDLYFGSTTQGAQPSALHLEAVRRFEIKEYPASVALGWGHTSQSAALLFPRNRYAVAFNISILRNTILSLEVRHDRNYAAGTVAGGLSLDPEDGSVVSAPAPGAAGYGHSSTTFSAVFSAFF